MLYLEAAQGSQGRGQGSEAIVRQVKVSDQEQLLQMAEHRQILRRGDEIPSETWRKVLSHRLSGTCPVCPTQALGDPS